MGKNQIKYLRLLGYEDTVEDGALLQYKRFRGMARYVWKGESFSDVLSAYTGRLAYAVRFECINKL